MFNMNKKEEIIFKGTQRTLWGKRHIKVTKGTKVYDTQLGWHTKVLVAYEEW
jgi:hypothetical protein